MAQDVIKQQSCEGNPYQHTVDSLKQFYASQGYTVLREASMVMESEYEMPIVMPMNQGTGYQFIFIEIPLPVFMRYECMTGMKSK
ncbi:hypothetical protein [Paraflavitalea speifideaquila]|uniref:hypothetical protein n=1 Tax=Paraflavitalea speifideaquila TaxID=3076558 RepID=UPI0028E8A506|nr:hypothetical protein [Paraflavitalea speifideiaquila]